MTARKRSCGKVTFLHLSVILFTGGVYPSMQWLTYPLGRPPQADTPTEMATKRAIRILLKCILVLTISLISLSLSIVLTLVLEFLQKHRLYLHLRQFVFVFRVSSVETHPNM